MEGTIKEIFITSFFRDIEENDITYCVLRNYQNLPNPGEHDIDILIENTDQVFDRVEKVICSLGWKVLYRIKQECFRSLLCYYSTNEGVQSVQLDLWTEEKWRGIKWIDSQSVLSSRSRLGIVYIPSKGSEAAITLLKEIIGNTHVKKGYYEIIQNYAIDDRNGFFNALQPVFKDYTEELYNKCINGDFEYFNLNIRKIRKNIIFKNFSNIQVYLKETIKKVGEKFIHFINPRGKLIVFVGPDGSGKTTLINYQEKYLESMFTKVQKYHIRLNMFPELKTGHGFSSMKGKINQKNNSVKKGIKKTKNSRSFISVLASWYVVGYYTLEFFIGKFVLLRLKQKNNLILFDRYYYDHFTQPTTRDLIFPFRKFLLIFATKPDVVIHLKANPEIVYKRKQELSVREIEVQNNYMTKVLAEESNVFSIDTSTRDAESISTEIFTAVVSTLSQV